MKLDLTYEDLAFFSDDQSAWVEESGTDGKVKHDPNIANYPHVLKPEFDQKIPDPETNKPECANTR